jgi:hypothetical protein
VPEEASSLQIRGLTRFRATLKKAGADMADLKEANVAVATTVASRAKAIGPSRSGRLVGSVQPSKTVGRARVRSSLVYAPVIHYGWPRHHIRPQPFVTEAAAETSGEWMATYEKALQDLANTVQGV